MSGRRRLAVLLAPALLAAASPGAVGEEPPPPKDLGLVESAVSRLHQIDMTVSGPEATLRGLRPEDLTVKVGFWKLRRFVLDRVCHGSAAEPEAEGAAVPSQPPPGAPTFVLYFDHPHLTQTGRVASLDLAREIVPKIVAGGGRAMVVSNAAELHTYVPLTDDPSVIVRALERMKSDRAEWDFYASQEEDRVADVERLLGVSGDASNANIEMAIARARAYQLEERWRQERDLRRLEMILGRLADIDAPKAILYFADTMRANAGEHYLSFFGPTTLGATAKGQVMETYIRNDAETGKMNLDRVIDQAAALGIRFFTVEGAGLVADSLNLASRSGASTTRSSAEFAANSQRHRDAQETLASLATETGGRAFLNGAPSAKVARRINDDLRCVFLISFDPRGFPRDTPLEVKVKTKLRDVEIHVRGRTVIQGDSSRLTAKLLASFAAPEASRSDFPVRVGVVPLGYRRGEFVARVQVAVPGAPVAGAKWDVGASLVSQGAVRADASGRAEVPVPGIPVVLERDMTFAPGPYELVAVAHEAVTDQIGSVRVEGRWHAPEETSASIASLALLQPFHGAVIRDGAPAAPGQIVIGEGGLVRSDEPAAVVGLVCRSRDQKAALRVERVLLGEGETEFLPAEIGYVEGEPCAQIRDVIPRDVLGEGRYRYVMRVADRTGPLARAERSFVVPPRKASSGAPGRR